MKPISPPGLLGQCVLHVTVPVAVALGLYASQQQQYCPRYARHELRVYLRQTQQLYVCACSRERARLKVKRGRGAQPAKQILL